MCQECGVNDAIQTRCGTSSIVYKQVDRWCGKCSDLKTCRVLWGPIEQSYSCHLLSPPSSHHFYLCILEVCCYWDDGEVCPPVSVTGVPGSNQFGLCPLQRKGESKDWGTRKPSLWMISLCWKPRKEKHRNNLQGNLLLTIQLLGLSQVLAWLPSQVHD